jgi:hypothetical protein
MPPRSLPGSPRPASPSATRILLRDALLPALSVQQADIVATHRPAPTAGVAAEPATCRPRSGVRVMPSRSRSRSSRSSAYASSRGVRAADPDQASAARPGSPRCLRRDRHRRPSPTGARTPVQRVQAGSPPCPSPAGHRVAGVADCRRGAVHPGPPLAQVPIAVVCRRPPAVSSAAEIPALSSFVRVQRAGRHAPRTPARCRTAYSGAVSAPGARRQRRRRARGPRPGSAAGPAGTATQVVRRRPPAAGRAPPGTRPALGSSGGQRGAARVAVQMTWIASSTTPRSSRHGASAPSGRLGAAADRVTSAGAGSTSSTPVQVPSCQRQAERGRSVVDGVRDDQVRHDHPEQATRWSSGPVTVGCPRSVAPATPRMTGRSAG